MLPFRQIYFDTDMLRAGGWPRGKVDLEAVLTYSKELKVKVFIPEPVERELEEGWIRRIRDNRVAIIAGIQAINGECKNIAPTQKPPTFDDLEALRGEYRKQVNRFKGEWGIEISPFTPTSLKDVHEMSVGRKLPSEEKKDRKSKHFQDVVIFLSIVDHLRATKAPAALVSADGVFEDERMVAIANAAGVSVMVYKSLKDIATALEKGLEHEFRLQLEKDRQQARSVLSAMEDRIKKHIIANVRFTDRGLLVKILEVKDLENLKIGDVVLPPEIGEKPFEFFFDVSLDVVALVEQFQIPQLPGLKVGEARAEPSPMDFIAAFNNPVVSTATVPKTVAVSAKARVVNKQFEVMELGFAYIKGMWGLAGLSQQDALSEGLADYINANTSAT